MIGWSVSCVPSGQAEQNESLNLPSTGNIDPNHIGIFSMNIDIPEYVHTYKSLAAAYPLSHSPRIQCKHPEIFTGSTVGGYTFFRDMIDLRIK